MRNIQLLGVRISEIRKKEHTPLIPSQEGNKKSGFKERISHALYHLKGESVR